MHFAEKFTTHSDGQINSFDAFVGLSVDCAPHTHLHNWLVEENIISAFVNFNDSPGFHFWSFLGVVVFLRLSFLFSGVGGFAALR